MDKYIKINQFDTVAVALEEIKKGTRLDYEDGLIALEDIPAGHKIALEDIAAGSKIIKYGNPIGLAKEDIKRGSWVHVHNIKTGLGDLLEYSYEPIAKKEGFGLDADESLPDTFLGFRRENGSVGIRNEVWIIPTVGCVNNIATKLATAAAAMKRGSVDDIVAFPHPYGCSQMGDDQENTRTILADLINHPNAGAVLVLGLGCENSNIDVLKPYIKDAATGRVKYLVCQESEDEFSDALDLLEELIDYAAGFERSKCPVEELIVGLKCGGSDGFSGITANPLVGRFSDLLVARGGTTILTEVPEMFGAETILMNRCETRELFDETVDLINDFKNYFKSHNQTIYENPSPGNKKGGISTLEDKSLGCTQKSGSSQVRGVLSYGSRVENKGLNLLSAPGNDLVASTALAASGAQIVLFTTGRGTPFASPVPTMKISSNSALAEKKHNWIDFNAGRAVENMSLNELGSELYKAVIEVANGKKVKSEEAGFHDFAIFKNGVTL